MKRRVKKLEKGEKLILHEKTMLPLQAVSSQEDIEANLCLMAGDNSEVSSEYSNASFNSTNYNSLLQAFHETHKEANKLALSNNRLKGLNNWLDGIVKELEDEVLKLKTDFDHLEIIYKDSSDLDSCKPINCENCEALQKKVNSLITTASKHSMSTTNLNAILGSQNCVFEKDGIGYQIGFQGKERKYNIFFKMIEQRFYLHCLVSIV